MERHVQPEILDRLDRQDPEAIRSRADLRRINRLMGTERWILKQLASIRGEIDTVLEIGAGEGRLLTAIHQREGGIRCIGYDLVERPGALPSGVEWVSGDFLDALADMPLGPRTAVVADLILHHFEEAALGRIRAAFSEAAYLFVVEPDRSRLALFLGRCLLPFVGRVTRSDMITSIRAGFAKGEIGQILGKRTASESVWLGGRRVRLQ